MASRKPKRVLITGAAGKIGRALRQGLRGRYPLLRLSDVAPLDDAGPGEEVVYADLRDMTQVERAVAGTDAVVHLGGVPVEAEWERIHLNNIVGTYHLFEAARRHGVSRVAFASTNHVTGFYRRGRRVGPGDPVRPDSRYGVSKAFGEALARLYADKYGLGVVCLRIGSFQPRPAGIRMLSTWISPRDMVQLVKRSLEAPDIRFEIVYGVSANDRTWWDNPAAARIGYVPVDNAEAFAGKILEAHPPGSEPEVQRSFHGGSFCALEFVGDPSRIE